MASKRKNHSGRREGGRSKRKLAIAQFLRECVELKRDFERDTKPPLKA